jgi:hypothetical protein
VSKNPKLVEAHLRFVLSCMGEKSSVFGLAEKQNGNMKGAANLGGLIFIILFVQTQWLDRAGVRSIGTGTEQPFLYNALVRLGPSPLCSEIEHASHFQKLVCFRHWNLTV